MGRCRKASSGFDGSWTIRRENYFNNGFHRLMRANFWAEFSDDVSIDYCSGFFLAKFLATQELADH